MLKPVFFIALFAAIAVPHARADFEDEHPILNKTLNATALAVPGCVGGALVGGMVGAVKSGPFLGEAPSLSGKGCIAGAAVGAYIGAAHAEEAPNAPAEADLNEVEPQE